MPGEDVQAGFSVVNNREAKQNFELWARLSRRPSVTKLQAPPADARKNNIYLGNLCRLQLPYPIFVNCPAEEYFWGVVITSWKEGSTVFTFRVGRDPTVLVHYTVRPYCINAIAVTVPISICCSVSLDYCTLRVPPWRWSMAVLYVKSRPSLLFPLWVFLEVHLFLFSRAPLLFL